MNSQRHSKDVHGKKNNSQPKLGKQHKRLSEYLKVDIPFTES